MKESETDQKPFRAQLIGCQVLFNSILEQRWKRVDRKCIRWVPYPYPYVMSSMEM